MNDYDTLKSLCDEAENLASKFVDNSSPEFETWHTKAERFLIHKFGDESYEVKKFRQTYFTLLAFTSDTPESKFVDACVKGLLSSKSIFELYLKEMEEDMDSTKFVTDNKKIDKTKIFIVHGHDSALKSEVARLIEKQQIEAVILSEQANFGKTIIEKIENYSDVGAAICLFTNDDLGSKKDENKFQPRARQNVVFETGYFIGKLGRENVIIVSEDAIELPSDMHGMVYSNKSDYQLKILKDLREIGFPIDFNKIP